MNSGKYLAIHPRRDFSLGLSLHVPLIHRHFFFDDKKYLGDSSLAGKFLQLFFFCQSIFDNLKAEEAGGLTEARTSKAAPRTQASIKLVVTRS